MLRPRHKYNVPPGLTTALDFALTRQSDMGYLVRDVPWNKDMFCCPGFLQPKEGSFVPQDEVTERCSRMQRPVDAATEILEARVLTNASFLNDVTEPAKKHWKHDNATQASWHYSHWSQNFV